MQTSMVDGLNTHNAAPRNGTPLSGVGGVPSGNLADQVVNSALRYRAQAPLVDSLLKEIGLNGSDIQGLTAGVAIANHDEKTEASK